MINFKQAFDKLTEAYVNGRVNPHNPCACFCGNLLNGDSRWTNGRSLFESEFGIVTSCIDGYNYAQEFISLNSDDTYSVEDIIGLEKVFMKELTEWYEGERKREDMLFTAFCKALEELKRIHIAKGENIDEQFEFKKRNIAVAEKEVVVI